MGLTPIDQVQPNGLPVDVAMTQRLMDIVCSVNPHYRREGIGVVQVRTVSGTTLGAVWVTGPYVGKFFEIEGSLFLATFEPTNAPDLPSGQGQEKVLERERTECGAVEGRHRCVLPVGHTPQDRHRDDRVAERERTDALCSFCGESCVGDVGGHAEAMGLIDARVLGGYASTPGNGSGALDDGNSYTFSLCEFCLDWLFTRFKTPPVVRDYLPNQDDTPKAFRPAEVRVSEDSWRKQKQKFFDEAARRSVAARGHPDRTDEKLYVETFKKHVIARLMSADAVNAASIVEEIPWSTCYVPLEPIPLTDAERAFAENVGKVLAARERELVPGFFPTEQKQIPSVGRLVHYFGKLSKNDYPEPHDGPFAALVIDVTSKDVVTLEVTGRTGQKYIRAGVRYSEAMDMSTWCWPVRT